METVCVIPARFESTRLPGKPLMDICGKPMLYWTYMHAMEVKDFKKVVVLTDDDRIADLCVKYDMTCELTSNKHDTHVSRIQEYSEKENADYYVCVCGDEPLVNSAMIAAIIPKQLSNDIYVSSLMRIIKDPTEVTDPNNIKVVTDLDDNCIFLSRSPIPFPYTALNFQYKKTIGIECYNKKALDAFIKLPKQTLEKTEDITLQRFLENNIPISFKLVEGYELSVDTKKDLETVRSILNSNNNVSLLDCTLRDGGYVNDWNFGKYTIHSVFQRLVDAGVEYIEIGFLDDRVKQTDNRSIQPNTKALSSLITGCDKSSSKVLAMIDYGTCDISNIEPKNSTNLDCIRVIFKKPNKEKAIAYAKQLMDLGYDVFLQLVSITSYSDYDMSELIDEVNVLKPYAISIVDTYGLMHKEDMFHYFQILDDNLDKNIRLGYHSHNNFQLGYSNSIEFINKLAHRNLIVDGTAYGMGKSAGNAPLELLAMYMNDNLNKNYNVGQILEIIDTEIMREYRKKYWGYSLKFYMSAANDCHPNYVAYLIDKKSLSINSINEILSTIPEENKLNYDSKLIENMYEKYQYTSIEKAGNVDELNNILSNKNILLIGPGSSIDKNMSKIKSYIDDPEIITIYVNCILDVFDPDYIFISNSKRYGSMFRDINRLTQDRSIKIIGTSNITPIQKTFDYVLDYETLSSMYPEIKDNSLILILNYLRTIRVNKIILAGFDGFIKNSTNYTAGYPELSFDFDRFEKLNRVIHEYIETYGKIMNIESITPSKYI